MFAAALHSLGKLANIFLKDTISFWPFRIKKGSNKKVNARIRTYYSTARRKITSNNYLLRHKTVKAEPQKYTVLAMPQKES